MAEKVSASVARVADEPTICRRRSPTISGRTTCRPALRMGDDPLLAGLPWTRTPIEVKRGASDGDRCGRLSHAFAGVAETGTLVLASGGDNPTTINFLPETHIVVVKADDIAGDYEAAWDKLRCPLRQGADAAHGQHG